MIGAVVAVDGRCRPKERKGEADRGAVEMLIESERLRSVSGGLRLDQS